MDLFEVVEMSPVGVSNAAQAASFGLWPNPNSGRIEVHLADGAGMLEVIDGLGRIAAGPYRIQQERTTIEHDLPAGAYLVRVTTDQGPVLMQRMLVN